MAAYAPPTEPVDSPPDYIVPRFFGGILGRPIRVRRGPNDITPRSIDLSPEQEDADAREQQAIADAVEGVIP